MRAVLAACLLWIATVAVAEGPFQNFAAVHWVSVQITGGNTIPLRGYVAGVQGSGFGATPGALWLADAPTLEAATVAVSQPVSGLSGGGLTLSWSDTNITYSPTQGGHDDGAAVPVYAIVETAEGKRSNGFAVNARFPQSQLVVRDRYFGATGQRVMALWVVTFPAGGSGGFWRVEADDADISHPNAPAAGPLGATVPGGGLVDDCGATLLAGGTAYTALNVTNAASAGINVLNTLRLEHNTLLGAILQRDSALVHVCNSVSGLTETNWYTYSP